MRYIPALSFIKSLVLISTNYIVNITFYLQNHRFFIWTGIFWNLWKSTSLRKWELELKKDDKLIGKVRAAKLATSLTQVFFFCTLNFHFLYLRWVKIQYIQQTICWSERAILPYRFQSNMFHHFISMTYL